MSFLKPACPSAMTFSAGGLSLLRKTFNMSLLGWLTRLCSTVSFLKAGLSFSDDVLRWWLEPVKEDLQHGFAWVADEACSTVSFLKSGLSFSDDVLRWWLEPVKEDLQHVFAWVADEAL